MFFGPSDYLLSAPFVLYFLVATAGLLSNAPLRKPWSGRSRLGQLLKNFLSPLNAWLGFFMGGLVGALLSRISGPATVQEFHDTLRSSFGFFAVITELLLYSGLIYLAGVVVPIELRRRRRSDAHLPKYWSTYLWAVSAAGALFFVISASAQIFDLIYNEL